MTKKSRYDEEVMKRLPFWARELLDTMEEEDEKKNNNEAVSPTLCKKRKRQFPDPLLSEFG
jgi:hypothetical protein